MSEYAWSMSSYSIGNTLAYIVTLGKSDEKGNIDLLAVAFLLEKEADKNRSYSAKKQAKSKRRKKSFRVAVAIMHSAICLFLSLIGYRGSIFAPKQGPKQTNKT